MALSPDLVVVTPPSLHLQPAGRRLLLVSRDSEVTAEFVRRAYGLWADEAVTLYVWNPDAADAAAWLLHHMAYCPTVVIDLTMPCDLLLLLAGSRLGSEGLYLLAAGGRGDALEPLLALLHPHPVAHRIGDLMEHLKAAVIPPLNRITRSGDGNV
jgi:hypothetical protein